CKGEDIAGGAIGLPLPIGRSPALTPLRLGISFPSRAVALFHRSPRSRLAPPSTNVRRGVPPDLACFIRSGLAARDTPRTSTRSAGPTRGLARALPRRGSPPTGHTPARAGTSPAEARQDP